MNMDNELEIVDCEEHLWEFIRKLRNNPEVQSGFIENNYISKDDQAKYMGSNSKYYRVCLKKGIPVGYFGVIKNDIRICTSPQYQNQGIGEFMLKELKKIWPKANAKIKIKNKASQALFLKSGYSKTFIILENKNL